MQEICPTKGSTHSADFVSFAKKSVTSSLRPCSWSFLDLLKFAMANFKDAVACLGAGQIFVRLREIWQTCHFTRHDVNQENLISNFSCLVVVFQSEARQNYFILTRKTIRGDGRFVHQYAAWRSILYYGGSWVYFPAASSGLTCTSLWKPTKYTSTPVCKPPESAEYMYKYLRLTNICRGSLCSRLTNWKFGRDKFLSRFLEKQNKCCQSSASGT